MPLELSIVTPDAEALRVTCDEVTAPGISGEIGLLPGHVPLVTALRPGILTVVREGKRIIYAVSTGFAELEGEKVTVLTDSCELASEVDVERSKREREAAEKALETLGEEDDEFEVNRIRLQRAQARLDAAEMRPAH